MRGHSSGRQLRILTLAGLVASAGATPGWAQGDGQSFADLGSRLQMEKPATVVTTSGQVVKGKLTTLSATSLALLVDGRLQTLAAEEVKRVQQRQADSLWNGVLIGAASGAAYALMWFVRDPNECGGSLCGQEFVSSAGLGALIGLGIDALITHTVTIEISEQAHPRRIVPALSAGRGRASVGLRLRF